MWWLSLCVVLAGGGGHGGLCCALCFWFACFSGSFLVWRRSFLPHAMAVFADYAWRHVEKILGAHLENKQLLISVNVSLPQFIHYAVGFSMLLYACFAHAGADACEVLYCLRSLLNWNRQILLS